MSSDFTNPNTPYDGDNLEAPRRPVTRRRYALWAFGVGAVVLTIVVLLTVRPGSTPRRQRTIFDELGPRHTWVPRQPEDMDSPPEPYTWLATIHDPHLLGRMIDRFPEIIEPKKHNSDSWVWQGAKLNRLECVDILLMRGAKPTADDIEVAVSNGHTQMFELLWRHGARSDDLMRRAAWQKEPAILAMLIARGVDVNAKGIVVGRTALHVAAEAGINRNVQLLLDEGAAVNAVDDLGYMPMDLAMYKGHVDVVDFLRAHGGRRSGKK